VSERLPELVGVLRARGSRVGLGELLCAYRAVAAVDPLSREDVRLALRATLCSGRDDLARFDEAFESVFGTGARADPLNELGAIERAALPRAGVPPDSGERRADSDDRTEDAHTTWRFPCASSR